MGGLSFWAFFNDSSQHQEKLHRQKESISSIITDPLVLLTSHSPKITVCILIESADLRY